MLHCGVVMRMGASDCLRVRTYITYITRNKAQPEICLATVYLLQPTMLKFQKM